MERRPLRTPWLVKGKMFAYVRLCSPMFAYVRLMGKKMFKSLFGNYEGRCFRGKGRMASSSLICKWLFHKSYSPALAAGFIRVNTQEPCSF